MHSRGDLAVALPGPFLPSLRWVQNTPKGPPLPIENAEALGILFAIPFPVVVSLCDSRFVE